MLLAAAQLTTSDLFGTEYAPESTALDHKRKLADSEDADNSVPEKALKELRLDPVDSMGSRRFRDVTYDLSTSQQTSDPLLVDQARVLAHYARVGDTAAVAELLARGIWQQCSY